MFKKIVWATDGSAAADSALPYVKDLASNNGGSAVVIVHSTELLLGPHAGGDPVRADEDQLQAKISGQARELAAAGFEVQTKFVGGPSAVGAARHIADAAQQVDGDLIVVGTRGRSPASGLLLGSVAQRLMHISRCPVLAVPPKA